MGPIAWKPVTVHRNNGVSTLYVKWTWQRKADSSLLAELSATDGIKLWSERLYGGETGEPKVPSLKTRFQELNPFVLFDCDRLLTLLDGVLSWNGAADLRDCKLELSPEDCCGVAEFRLELTGPPTVNFAFKAIQAPDSSLELYRKFTTPLLWYAEELAKLYPRLQTVIAELYKDRQTLVAELEAAHCRIPQLLSHNNSLIEFPLNLTMPSWLEQTERAAMATSELPQLFSTQSFKAVAEACGRYSQLNSSYLLQPSATGGHNLGSLELETSAQQVARKKLGKPSFLKL